MLYCVKKQKKGPQSGFTLLETAVAMVVMMIGGLGIAAVFSYAVKNNNGSRDRAIAIAVAQQEIERLRSVEFNDPALAATPTLVTPITVTNGGRSFSLRTTILNTTPTLKTIQVRVTPLGNPNAWASRTVQITIQRAAFTLGAYTGGP
ncbi:MAG TPA: prepilin-type N-terminal cleavage/methylation domain-containing protein [Pyrinomonadaceae bacterium]|jgi:Tfp pilus assembly protein PilV|nr:prepilin-type N-terminal cleavage/methylation domain-containing protein [Pyrinomonadaceae bacterium]